MLQNSNPFYANCFSILAEVQEFLQIVSGFWLKVRIRQICKGLLCKKSIKLDTKPLNIMIPKIEAKSIPGVSRDIICSA